jgi:hypothetical protein
VNKILLSLTILVCTQSVYAGFPLPFMPTLPNLPMFGEFNPNKLRAEFNQFVGIPIRAFAPTMYASPFLSTQCEVA